MLTPYINKTHDRAIKSFEAISKFKTYSKTNQILEKTFKANSLKSFIITLKKPKIFIKPKFLEEFAKRHPYVDEQLKGTELKSKRKTTLEKKKSIQDLEKTKKNTQKNQKKNDFHQYNIFIKKANCESDINPFVYNPNYNAIYPKSPCYKIHSPIKKLTPKKQETENSEKSEKTLSPLSLKILKKHKKFHTNTNSLIKTYNSPFKKGEINKTSPCISLHKNKKVNKKIKLIDKNNHAFKFNDYVSRKDLINASINPNLTYLEPYNYTKGKNNTIDFKKMTDKGKEFFINIPSLSVPTSNFYRPKYEYIETQPMQVLFTPQDKINKNKKNKKLLLHKLWTSYNVGTYYTLVDNNKL